MCTKVWVHGAGIGGPLCICVRLGLMSHSQGIALHDIVRCIQEPTNKWLLFLLLSPP